LVLNVQNREVRKYKIKSIVYMLKSFVVVLILAIGIQAAALGQDNPPAKELVQYVRDAKKAGLDKGQIEQNAIKAGWPAAAVTAAIATLDQADKTDADALPKTTPAPPAENWDTGNNPTSPNAIARPASPPNANPAPPAKDPASAPSTTPKEAPSTTPKEEVPGAKTPPPVNRGVADDYRIGEGDVLQINVFGEPTASVGSAVVRPDGKISVPLVKEVLVAGLTPVQLEKIITEQLSKMLRAPDVTIVVAQINSKKIFMTGAVKKEGPLNYTYRMTVMQAISESGGLTDYAKRKKIYILRSENGSQFQFPFNYDAVMRGLQMEQNIFLEPGDMVVVPH